MQGKASLEGSCLLQVTDEVERPSSTPAAEQGTEYLRTAYAIFSSGRKKSGTFRRKVGRCGVETVLPEDGRAEARSSLPSLFIELLLPLFNKPGIPFDLPLDFAQVPLQHADFLQHVLPVVGKDFEAFVQGIVPLVHQLKIA